MVKLVFKNRFVSETKWEKKRKIEKLFEDSPHVPEPNLDKNILLNHMMLKCILKKIKKVSIVYRLYF